jgi:hypothetical protein
MDALTLFNTGVLYSSPLKALKASARYCTRIPLGKLNAWRSRDPDNIERLWCDVIQILKY